MVPKDPWLHSTPPGTQGRLYVFGFIKYHDGYLFNLLSHATGFCSVYDPSNNSNSIGMFNSFGYENYAYGNQ